MTQPIRYYLVIRPRRINLCSRATSDKQISRKNETRSRVLRCWHYLLRFCENNRRWDEFRYTLRRVQTIEHISAVRFWDNNVRIVRERDQSWNGRGEMDRSVSSGVRNGILLDCAHLVQLQLLRSLCLRHVQYTAGIIDLPPFCRTNAMSSSVWLSENPQAHFDSVYLIGVAKTRIVLSDNGRSINAYLALFGQIYP